MISNGLVCRISNATKEQRFLNMKTIYFRAYSRVMPNDIVRRDILTMGLLNSKIFALNCSRNLSCLRLKP
jgi:hypothetical protein